MENTKNEQQCAIHDVSTSICQHCGKQEGDYCINPYIEDVNGREEWEYICNDCYRELVADI